MTRSTPFKGAACSAVMLAGTLVSASSAFAGGLPATGQTAAYQADKNDGIPGPVDVPDDGTLQRGSTPKYKVQKDGTVKDSATGLSWEVKCTGPTCAPLHNVANTYVWSGNGTQETIWDWLDARTRRRWNRLCGGITTGGSRTGGNYRVWSITLGSLRASIQSSGPRPRPSPGRLRPSRTSIPTHGT